MKIRIPTATVTAAHPYTRSDEPWLMDECTEANGCTTTGHFYGWKLFHYLTGGGIRGLGRTLQQEIRDRRQTRFLVIFGILAFCWLLLLVF